LPTGKETHTATKLVISKARREDRGNSCIVRESQGSRGIGWGKVLGFEKKSSQLEKQN
jgi:hypothetical protein